MESKRRDRIVTEVFKSLSHFNTSVVSESVVQYEISECLKSSGLKFEKEFLLDRSSRIDFFVEDSVGIEVKIKGPSNAIYRQIKRYSKFNCIKSLVLATSWSVGLPEEIEGTPLYYYSLSQNLL